MCVCVCGPLVSAAEIGPSISGKLAYDGGPAAVALITETPTMTKCL